MTSRVPNVADELGIAPFSGVPKAKQPPDPATLGGRIKIIRLSLGMTQREFADEVGVTESQTVSNWERGQTPEPERLDAIVRVSGREEAWVKLGVEVAQGDAWVDASDADPQPLGRQGDMEWAADAADLDEGERADFMRERRYSGPPSTRPALYARALDFKGSARKIADRAEARDAPLRPGMMMLDDPPKRAR